MSARSQFLIGDGQVTLGSQVIKPTARKVRQLKEGVICGFAGATADAMTLFERLEGQLQAHPETMRACVEMAKAWRMDKYLRRLEAVMIVCDKDVSLTLTGTGDVIEPADGVIGIGSGGHFATAAATALMGVEGMQADEIGRRAMTIAANMCVYTVRARLLASGFFLFIDCRYADVSRCHLSLCVQNHNFIELELTQDPKEEEEKPSD